MEKFKKCLKEWLDADRIDKWSEDSSKKLRALYDSVPEEVNFSQFMDKLLSRPTWDLDAAYREIVAWMEQELHIPPKEPITDEESKKKLALTASQKVIIDQLNSLFKMAKSEGIKFVFDEYTYSFAAINGEEVLELQDDILSEDAVNIENCVDWGNLDPKGFFGYTSGWFNLYAQFKK